MAKPPKHLDNLFKEWPYEFGEIIARKVRGSDGRPLVQLRIDMGVLQLEVDGRPDGTKPGGETTYLDYLCKLALEEQDDFELDDIRCVEVDREFVQYYHRRIAWLSLGEFERAASDAQHSLELMDFSSLHAPHQEWAEMHEQYRPFVLFHRSQALALAALESLEPSQAIDAIEHGMHQIADAYRLQGADDDDLAEDEFLLRLEDMKESLEEQYDFEEPLAKQLAEAVAREQYELAAEIRDRIARRKQPKR